MVERRLQINQPSPSQQARRSLRRKVPYSLRYNPRIFSSAGYSAQAMPCPSRHHIRGSTRYSQTVGSIWQYILRVRFATVGRNARLSQNTSLPQKSSASYTCFYRKDEYAAKVTEVTHTMMPARFKLTCLMHVRAVVGCMGLY
jgi:hypothetical protein